MASSWRGRRSLARAANAAARAKAARVKTYTGSAYVAKGQCPMLIMERELGDVRERRGWAMTSGRVWASETRCMEAAVFFCEFNHQPTTSPKFLYFSRIRPPGALSFSDWGQRCTKLI